MCASLMGSIARSGECGRFALRDMHAQKRLPFGREAVERDIHVIDRDGQVYKGAQAILRIAAQYRGLGVLEKIGAFPLVRPLLPIGYRLVAVNRRFLFGPASRIFWLKTIVVLAFCLGLAMSPHLWIGPRSFPVAPVFDVLPRAVRPVDDLLFAALFALAGAILVSPRPQKFMAAFLAITIIFCLLDQTRWQPWVFLYGFLLATLALFSWDSEDVAGRNRALNIARLIMAGTYFFSGLQKANQSFVQSEFSWIVSPITDVIPSAAPALHWLGDGGAADPGRVCGRTADAPLPAGIADRRDCHACLHSGHVRAARAELEQHHLALDGGDGGVRHRSVHRQARIFLARCRSQRPASLARRRPRGVHRPAGAELRRPVGFLPVGRAL